MNLLKQQVIELDARIKSLGGQVPLSGLALDGGDVLVQCLPQIRLVFLYGAERYPRSPVLACCDDDATSAKLAPLSEVFEAEGELTDVLQETCRLLGLGAAPLFDKGHDSSMDEGEEDAQGFDGDEDCYSIDSSDDSGDDYLAENEDVDTLRDVMRKKTRWQAVETAKVEAQALKGDTALSTLEKVAKDRQIFAPQESYNQLARELEMLLREKSVLDPDAVGDDVFHWRLNLGGVSEQSPLAQDMRECQRQWGYDTIQIVVRFKRGLHPFYPPSVDLIRPRFQGPVGWALSSHPMLRLENWDPWRSQKDLIVQLRTFLEAAGRVDFGTDLNDPVRHPDSSYLHIERTLAQLEALTGVPPKCLEQFKDLYGSRTACVDASRIEALAPSSKRAKMAAELGPGEVWAKGTGYGHGSSRSGNVWDPKTSEAMQEAHDALMQALLDDLVASLRTGFPEGTVEERLFLTAVESSCLLPFLVRELSTPSFAEMSSRAQYFATLLQVVAQLLAPRTAHVLATADTCDITGWPASTAGNGLAIIGALRKPAGQAEQFLQILGRGGPSGSSTPPSGGSGGRGQALQTLPASLTSALNLQGTEEEVMKEMAQRLMAVASATEAAAPEASAPQPSSRTASGPPATPTRAGVRTRASQASASALAQAPAGDADYVQHFQSLMIDVVAGLARTHKLRPAATSEPNKPRQRMVRLSKEIAGLASELPLHPSSSVFVRVDEADVHLWKALITGPEGTPYDGGMFEFHCYFPSTYPTVPPKVEIVTTGGGTVRFNPNLYDCGKVCLSLLGTWPGAQGEGWIASKSSFLQVAVSIQSLIFVDEPWFNEPGYEKSMHTNDGRERSQCYNQNLREQTLHWAVYQQMKKPPAGFEEVVRRHFKCRRAHVQATAERWIKECRDGSVQKRMQTYLAKALELIEAA